MAGVVNIVVLGITGILSLPAITGIFAPKDVAQLVVAVGVGSSNSLFPDSTLGGNLPTVAVFDINGVPLGRVDGIDSKIVDGGSFQVTMKASGNNAICVSWLSTTSSNNDFHTWNGASAKFCGLPWYPSTSPFPGLSTPFRPPCFWMSNDGHFVDGFSARLTDFAFPGDKQANATATQWARNPETLCEAPGRQQFFNATGDCIPMYPSGPESVNGEHARDANGFDADFEAIRYSATMTCTNVGIPFNNVNLQVIGPPAGFVQPSANPAITIPAGVTLQSSLALGHLRRATKTFAHDALSTITAAPTLPKKKSKRELPLKEPVLNRRIEKRIEEPHKWYEENQLVISEDTEHSAVDLCLSESSWGPDFVSVHEGVFCDMCERKTYPLCGGEGVNGSCFDLEGRVLVGVRG
ncbi:hypothetical protein B0J14DRAFT_688722 [Halenospora varia]|nr:hypothetical protein B0J14DRAFT_688722 [Halenospora varia]